MTAAGVGADSSSEKRAREHLSDTPTIRRALLSERARVVKTVTAAFANDPAWGWLMGDDLSWLP